MDSGHASMSTMLSTVTSSSSAAHAHRTRPVRASHDIAVQGVESSSSVHSDGASTPSTTIERQSHSRTPGTTTERQSHCHPPSPQRSVHSDSARLHSSSNSNNSARTSVSSERQPQPPTPQRRTYANGDCTEPPTASWSRHPSTPQRVPHPQLDTGTGDSTELPSTVWDRHPQSPPVHDPGFFDYPAAATTTSGGSGRGVSRRRGTSPAAVQRHPQSPALRDGRCVMITFPFLGRARL